METPPSKSETNQKLISIKVLHAVIVSTDRCSSSSLFLSGKYYTEIEWVQSSSDNAFSSSRIRKTPYSTNDKNNKILWDYFCSPYSYRGIKPGDTIGIRIFCLERTSSRHSQSTVNNKLYASVCISGDELLGTIRNESITSNEEVWLSPEVNLPLKKDGEEYSDGSTITIQTQFFPIKYGVPDQLIWNNGSFLEVTLQHPNSFQVPVKPIGVSGGTAAFFHLRLKENSSFNKSRAYYIGKDLSHAVSESTFYEDILKLQSLTAKSVEEQRHYRPLLNLFQFTLEYAGVLSALDESKNMRNLLVLRNLFDNTSKLRLIDLKIGERTASAGWKGKSRTHAFRQSLFDQITNSKCEGFRLEGFESPPETISSILPKLDAHAKMNHMVQSTKNAAKTAFGSKAQTDDARNTPQSTSNDAATKASLKMSLPFGINKKKRNTNDIKSTKEGEECTSDFVKKSLKVLFQTMNGSDIFMHFLDLHQQHFNHTSTTTEQHYTSDEYTEIIMHQIVQTLLKIAVACHQITIPQKWVGSSLAIGYDVASLPLTSQSEQQIRSSIKIHLFDWGRSELTTIIPDTNDDGTTKQVDRTAFWNYYEGAILKIFWTAAKSYIRRFGNAEDGKCLKITICNLFSGMDEDYLGQVTVPLLPTALISSPILARNSTTAIGVVQYSIEWTPCSTTPSRLKGSWHIHIAQAHIYKKTSALQKMLSTIPNPYCVITAIHSNSSFDQVTSMKPNTYNPVWNETFTVPIAARSNEVKEAFLQSGVQQTDELENILNLLNKCNSAESHHYRFLPTTGTFSSNFSSKSIDESKSEMESLSYFLKSSASL